MIQKLETDRPQRNWTSWVASVGRPKHHCLSSVNRSPVIFVLCAWTPLIPDDTEVRDLSPSETPDLVGDLGRRTELPVPEFGKPITGDIHSLHVDALIPDDIEVIDQLPSETLDLQVASVKRPEHPCLGAINRSPVIFILFIWTSRCQTIPKLETYRPQKHRTS